MKSRASRPMFLVAVAAGVSAAIAGSPAAAQSPRPTPVPMQTAAPVAEPNEIVLPAAYRAYSWHRSAFSLRIAPDLVRATVPDHGCVFLVSVQEAAAGASFDERFVLTADAPGAVVSIVPNAVVAGEVAEVTVVPAMASVDTTRSLTVRAERAGVAESATAAFDVMPPWSDADGDLATAQMAAEIRDEFIPWLAKQHPELRIDESTAWESMATRPYILVVQYHLFFSDEWEMGVRWHVMIPPYDWSEIYLRHRWNESRPMLAFKLESRTGGIDPVPVEPEDTVWR